MRKRIGEFLVEKGVISEDQVREILKHSQRTGLRFGDAAMDMGLLTRSQMIAVFGKNFAVDFFHLDARYFPEVTRGAISVDLILQTGALPLGLKTEYRWLRKKKVLNLGLLDPSRSDLDQLIETAKFSVRKLLGEEIHDVKLFLVLADQFIEVLDQVYQVSDSQIKERAAQKETALDGTLQMFLETQS